MRNYKNIIAWQRGHELTLQVYSLSRSFPAEERYGITSQIRRAAYSIPANIAEGSGRGTHKDYLRFLHIALGSLKEVEYFILLSTDLQYMNRKDFEQVTVLINRTFATLTGLIAAVEKEVGT